MIKLKQSVAISALMIGALAHPAFADLTAEEAWTSLKDAMVGYNITGDESRSGDTLTVNNVTFVAQMEAPGDSVTMALEALQFVENGDGTVTLQMPASIPITTTVPVEGDQTLSLSFSVSQSGASMLFSGTPDALVQTYKADSLTVVIDQFDAPNDDIPTDFLKVSLSMNGLASETRMTAGDPRPMSFNATGDSISYDVSVQVPEEEDSFAMQGQINDLAMTGGGSIPANAASADLLELLAAGYAMTGEATFGAGQMSFNVQDDGSTVAAESQSGGGALRFDVDADSIGYGLSQSGVALTVTTSDLPFPVSAEMLGAEFDLTVPMKNGPEPQDFALRMNLTEFSMSDMLWALFDPTAVLPRDPATLLVDLAGQATVFANLFDEQAVEEMAQAGQMPAQINGLDVKGLHLKLAGADLQGTGTFTFDNSDLQTFGGMPRPTGAVDLTLAGGNALLDKLVQLGFVGQQEAGGARMMMGLLAVPGDSPDTLKSRLEINDQGHISANGQRIQ